MIRIKNHVINTSHIVRVTYIPGWESEEDGLTVCTKAELEIVTNEQEVTIGFAGNTPFAVSRSKTLYFEGKEAESIWAMLQDYLNPVLILR